MGEKRNSVGKISVYKWGGGSKFLLAPKLGFLKTTTVLGIKLFFCCVKEFLKKTKIMKIYLRIFHGKVFSLGLWKGIRSALRFFLKALYLLAFLLLLSPRILCIHSKIDSIFFFFFDFIIRLSALFPFLLLVLWFPDFLLMPERWVIERRAVDTPVSTFIYSIYTKCHAFTHVVAGQVGVVCQSEEKRANVTQTWWIFVSGKIH